MSIFCRGRWFVLVFLVHDNGHPSFCPGAVCLRYRRLPVVPFSLRLHSSCSPRSISVLREADCKVNSLRLWIRWWRLVSTLNGFKRGVQRKWKRSVSCGSDLVEFKTLWPTERHYSNKRHIFTGNNLKTRRGVTIVIYKLTPPPPPLVMALDIKRYQNLSKMQKLYYCTIYYLLPGIIPTPVNKEIRAQMSNCTYKQFNVLWK